MTDQNFDYDLIIVGAGPGGYEAAYEAAKYGMHTAVVEKDKVGGTCLNRGCIPTKALMHCSDAFRAVRDHDDLGIDVGSASVFPEEKSHGDEIKPDYHRIYERKEGVLDTLRTGIEKAFKKDKIELFRGTAVVTGPNNVEVTYRYDTTENNQGSVTVTKNLTGKNIIIATGSRPAVPPIQGTDLDGVITSTELLELTGTPYEDLVIVGGGVVGAEFATVFNDWGTNVTVLEGTDRLIPQMDKELGRSLKTALKQQGVTVHTSAMVKSIAYSDEKNADGSNKLTVSFTEKDKEQTVTADKVLISTGRRPNTDDIFSEEFAKEYDFVGERHFINIDENCATACPSIYAIGDITRGMQLAHTATAQGRNVVAHINGDKAEISLNTVPGCIYSRPEIASVGMTQDDAKEAGTAVITKKYAMGANGKTVLEGLGRGYIKIVAREEDHVVIGAQLMCGRATDLVGELALAIRNGLTVEDIANTVHPHPTFVEAIGETARL